VGILLSFLRLYAVTHFGAEEAWMRRSGYPGMAEHTGAHDQFIKDILALTEQHEKPKGRGIAAGRAARWLERWLKQHVTVVDLALARHLRDTGTPPPDAGELPF
jgi:hemerythrin